MLGKRLEIIFWVLYIHYVSFIQGPPPGKPRVYSKELETELRKSIFTDYEIFQRPSKMVHVNVSLNMLSLNQLDIKDQSLSITAYFTMHWGDGRLSWNKNDTYNNIRFIFSNEVHMWRPAIVIENSVGDIDVISKPNVPMRIKKDGSVVWTPGGVFVTHCQSDATFWPLDAQVCDIKLSTWAYTSNEVSLGFAPDIFVMDFYQENGAWEILQTGSASSTSDRESQSFSRLKFSLTFRRRPLFHLLNTLFPVVLMGFLTVIVFKLPPESGERVGLALTILLAYAVYLTLISENIPQTSLSASILSAYLAVILLLQTLSVLLTVIYLDIYFTPEEKPVPEWLRTVTSTFLAKLARVDCRRSKISVVSQLPSNNPDDNDNGVFSAKSESKMNSVLVKELSLIDENADRKNEQIGSKLARPTTDDKQEAWTEYRNDKDKRQDYNWKDIALMLDKITMYLYLLLITGVTVVCMGIIGYKYTTYHASK